MLLLLQEFRTAAAVRTTYMIIAFFELRIDKYEFDCGECCSILSKST